MVQASPDSWISSLVSPTKRPRVSSVASQLAIRSAGSSKAILLGSLWSRRWDSNPRPATYEAAALPAELRRRLRDVERCQTLDESRPANVPLTARLSPYQQCRNTSP